MGASAPISARWLWTALATGPIAWALALLVNAVLSDLACGPGVRGWLIGIALLMLGVDVAAGAVALRWVRSTAPPLSDDSRHPQHLPFLAHLTLLSCALFAVAIAAHLVPPAVLHDCR